MYKAQRTLIFWAFTFYLLCPFVLDKTNIASPMLPLVRMSLFLLFGNAVIL